MDLFAYSQIENLELLAKKNGINVSRCRGYRLMKNEQPVSKEEIQEIIDASVLDEAERAVRSEKRFSLHPRWVSYSYWTDILADYYLVVENKKVVGIHWDRIHGKNRRNLKFLIKKNKKKILKSIGMFNKYCGQDVLYIHAKLGSTNWSEIKHYHYSQEPWYLESCDDWYDSSYCDIYAKIKEEV